MARGFNAILLGFMLSLPGGQTMETEEPVDETLRTTADVERRRSAPSRVAEVTVSGAFDEVGNAAFRILAGDLFGDNQGNAKIAMTAPVTQRPVETPPTEGTRIEMTAPVSQRPAPKQANASVVSFAMPARFTLDSLPIPNNPRIRLREEPARLVAARQYAGGWSEAADRKQEAQWLAAVRQAGDQTLGEPIDARDHSPFSLPFLRRNEVLIAVEAPTTAP